MFARPLVYSIKNNIPLSRRLISYYITTPIFYVNASPHIGHVHTLFLADALHVYNRLRLGNVPTILSTGTDEHGIKVQTAAILNNMSSRDFCDLNARKFSELFNHYETTVTDFIRTTEERHELAVKSVWNTLNKNGFIYKSNYSGWYCASDETFVPESQVILKEMDGQKVYLDQNENVLSWSSEENYMFRLSQFEDLIASWLRLEKPIVPEKFNDMVIQSLRRSPVGDISISRPANRLQWGIRVPCDSTQTIYVWLDALASYLTVAGYPNDLSGLKRWPIDCQVLGKDIIKFHAIYWPAFLLAMSLPLPKKLVCHSHWTVNSLKMSKSKGNVINPWVENTTLTEEGFRYYLLRASTNHSDTDYSHTQAVRRINSELADTYGNLMSRCCGTAINPSQTIPKCLIESPNRGPIKELVSQLSDLVPECEKHFDNADFYKGIDEIMRVLRLNNKLYEDLKPWKLVKSIDSHEESYISYSNLQAATFETLRICSILLQPIIPNISRKALDNLGAQGRYWRDARVDLETGDPRKEYKRIQARTDPILFRRIKV